jgi:hypothetical protein
MCLFNNINKRNFIEFNEPTYQKAVLKLEEYLNTNFNSKFKVVDSVTSKFTYRKYFKIVNIDNTHKMKIEYKLKYINRNTSYENLSKIGLLSFNNTQYNYCTLKVYLDITHLCSV